MSSDRFLQPTAADAASSHRGRRDVAMACFQAALAAAEPRAALHRFLRRDGDRLVAGDSSYDLRNYRRILVAGGGKAGTAMSRELESLLGDRLTAGLVIVKEGGSGETERILIREAGHPVPDATGVRATRELLDLVRSAGPDDLLLCPISGGGSALMVAPAPGLSLADKQNLTGLLLRAGCTIDEINAVRKHCSAIKGGQLARAANGATTLTLILSDVVGTPLDVVASGPTVPDPTTYADALAVLDRYGLREQVPLAIRQYLEAGQSGALPETPKPDDPCFERSQQLVVGSIALACDAAAGAAAELGCQPLVLTTFLEGEARVVARVLVALGREVAARGRPLARPACLILGGETTVVVRGQGKGGRNQELALAAALALDGQVAITVGAFATDGGDGPTDAAGAIVDGGTVAAARRAGLDPVAALQQNDAYPLLDRIGALVRTGPTGTNVNDLLLVLVG